LAASLHKFAKYGRNHKFKWGAKEEEDFQKIKDALTSCQVLYCPQPHLPFRIQTDASNIGLSRFPLDDTEMVNIATQMENIIGCVGAVMRSVAKAKAQNQQITNTNDQPTSINGQAMSATLLLLDQNQHALKISTNSDTILVLHNEQLK
ncbi:unnamed protein product, partial [Didymodactylos carnosus]